MKRLWNKCIPSTLKYRLFTSFLLLILIPFSILFMNYFQNIKKEMQGNISLQIHEQIDRMTQSLDNLISTVSKTAILLEKNSKVVSIVNNPEEFQVLERHRKMDQIFNTINNSFFLSNPQMYFTVIDLHGNVYTSFKSAKSINYKKITQKNWYSELFNRSMPKWVINDRSYLHPQESNSPYLISFYTLLTNRHNTPYGVARISWDFSEWFRRTVKSFKGKQNYFIINASGKSISQSEPNTSLKEQTIQKLVTANKKNGSFINKKRGEMITYNSVEGLGWYIVSRVPTEFLFSDIKQMKYNLIITFLLLTFMFIIITFFITSTITKPLNHLQMEMNSVVRKKLKVHIPEKQYKGEILSLTKNFNDMIANINQLIEQLKLEERQKESVRMEMLLSQMNPHFLLNTLNTIKWIALRHQNKDISTICVSLGKLLESSLIPNREIIHLKEEVKLVKSYIHIQKFRYHNQFEVLYEYDSDLGNALVPKFCLQPLIENAIYHGVCQLEETGQIFIRIFERNHYLFIDVEDNGVGIEKAHDNSNRFGQSKGIGLNNVRERLQLIFKQEASLHLRSLDKGTVASIRCPLLLSTPYNEGGDSYVESSTR